MKIVLTGGGSGGHFYPLIAVAEEIQAIVEDRKLLAPELIYIAPDVFDERALAEHNITYVQSSAGKMRRYHSILNVFDIFKTTWGLFRALLQLFSIYPDVIFSTGGGASVPPLFAARILRIPVILYDADSKPGRANRWAGKFARAIGVAHPDAGEAFPRKLRDKVALIGHPIRREIRTVSPEGGHEFLHLDPTVPTIYITGGSLGSQAINDAVIDALPILVEKYNVVHQAGRTHAEEVEKLATAVLAKSRFENRYRVFGLLNTLAIRMTAGITSVIISRAGSGNIFEIASWGIPAILIPIPQGISHDQTENAFSYARAGGAVVLEQHNLTPHLLVAEIDRLMEDKALQITMKEAAAKYSRPDAAQKLARIVLDTALEHTA